MGCLAACFKETTSWPTSIITQSSWLHVTDVASWSGSCLIQLAAFPEKSLPAKHATSHQVLQRCRHVVRLWRSMLLSLRQTLLQSCPMALVMDVLGATLQPAARRITAQYSKLHPSEAWQARLAADVWHIAETCRMITQAIGMQGRCACIYVEIHRNVSWIC